MAQAIAASSDVPPERRQALLRLWVMGVFDACAAGLEQGVGLTFNVTLLNLQLAQNDTFNYVTTTQKVNARAWETAQTVKRASYFGDLFQRRHLTPVAVPP